MLFPKSLVIIEFSVGIDLSISPLILLKKTRLLFASEHIILSNEIFIFDLKGIL